MNQDQANLSPYLPCFFTASQPYLCGQMLAKPTQVNALSAPVTVANKPPRWAHGLMAMQVLLFGPGFSLAALALAHIPPAWLIAVRTAVVGLVFAVVFVLMGGFGRLGLGWHTWRRPRILMRLVVMALVGIMGNQIFYLWGMRYTSPAQAAVLYALSPLVVLLLSAWVWRTERLTGAKLMALLVALVGVGVVLAQSPVAGPLREGMASNPPLGNALILLAVGCYAFFIAESRSLSRHYPALPLTALLMWLGPVLYLPFAVWWLPSVGWSLDFWAQIPADAWGGAAYVTVINIMLSFTIIGLVSRVLPASQVAVYVNFQPLTATMFSVWMLGEQLTWPLIIGGLLTLGGVLILQWAQQRCPIAGKTV